MCFGRFRAGFRARDRYERPRFEKSYINQRNLAQETDCKAPKLKYKILPEVQPSKGPHPSRTEYKAKSKEHVGLPPKTIPWTTAMKLEGLWAGSTSVPRNKKLDCSGSTSYLPSGLKLKCAFWLPGGGDPPPGNTGMQKGRQTAATTVQRVSLPCTLPTLPCPGRGRLAAPGLAPSSAQAVAPRASGTTCPRGLTWAGEVAA